MSDETSALERRKFLCVMGAAGAAGAVGSVAGCGTSAQPSGTFVVGTVAELTVGTWKRLADKKLIVGRDAAGFYAFSIICPHEGFDVDFEGSTCPASPLASTSTTGNLVCCSGHGGTFNPQGVVTRGPPTSNLAHFQVLVTGGNVSVNTGVSVALTARTPAA